MDKIKDFAELLRDRVNIIITECLILRKSPEEMTTLVSYAVRDVYNEYEGRRVE